MDSPHKEAMEAVKVHKEFIKNWFNVSIFKRTLKEKSYSMWAINELLFRLEQTPSVPPLLTMESFRDELYGFSLMNANNSSIFFTAYKAVDDAIHSLVSY